MASAVAYKTSTTFPIAIPTAHKERISSRITMRQIAFLLVNFVLYWPLMFILKKMATYRMPLFDYIFLVYPGSTSDWTCYCPKSFVRRFQGEHIGIGGIITGNRKMGGRGLVVVTPHSYDELRSPEMLSSLLKGVEGLRNSIGVKRVAYAGRLPGLLRDVSPGIVRLSKIATVYCIEKALERAAHMKEKSIEDMRVVVVGIGLIGLAFMRRLKTLRCKSIQAIDIAPRKCVYSLSSVTREQLADADVAIILTPSGSDFGSYQRLLPSQAIIIDDTHPEIPEHMLKGWRYIRVGMQLPHVRFFPPLPDFPSYQIPGCAIGAIVQSIAEKTHNNSIGGADEFKQLADSHGCFSI